MKAKKLKTDDGYCFYQLEDGTVVDNLDPTRVDMKWNSLDEFNEWQKEHDCWDNAVQYTSDGVLGHGWECGMCGKFLQAG